MSLLDAPYRYTSLQKNLLAALGLIIFLLVWWGVAETTSVQSLDGYDPPELPSSLITDPDTVALRVQMIKEDSIIYANWANYKKIYPLLPPPHMVFASYPDLIFPAADSQVRPLQYHAVISIWRNLQGYFWAVFFSLLLGIPIAIIPVFRSMFSRLFDTWRYIPITVLIPIFILIASPQTEAYKVSFLAFGIFVYLLPVVMQRVWETGDVYLKTAYTLGATDWQLVKTVYLPSVLSKVIDDVRVLTAISWTYIILAEAAGRTTGLGAYIYIQDRMANITGPFAVLLVIILIGFLQDQLFSYMNRRLFPHKDVKVSSGGLRETRTGFLIILGVVMTYLLLTLVTGTVPILGFIVAIIVAAAALLIIFGEFKLRTSAPTA